MQIVAFPLIRLAIRSTPCPQFGIVVFEQIIVQILVASLSQPPRASALRQARVSGGNLQNCAPSAACGGAYAPARFCHRQGRCSGSIWAKAFMVVRYLRNLAVLLNYRSQRSLIFTPNKHPRGTPILIGAGLAKPGQGGKMKSCLGGACSYPGNFIFSLPRGRVARATPSLKPAAFSSTTQVLCYFLP